MKRLKIRVLPSTKSFMIIGKYILEETEKTLIQYNFKWNLLKSIKIHGRKMCVEEEKKASFYKFTKIVNNLFKTYTIQYNIYQWTL